MTENKALLLDGIVGCLVTWGIVFTLGALGAPERFQAVAVMLGLAIPPFMFGVISEHYRRKREAERKDAEVD